MPRSLDAAQMQAAFPFRDLYSVGGLVDVAVAFTLAEYLFLGWRRKWQAKAMMNFLFALAPGSVSDARVASCSRRRGAYLDRSAPVRFPSAPSCGSGKAAALRV